MKKFIFVLICLMVFAAMPYTSASGEEFITGEATLKPFEYSGASQAVTLSTDSLKDAFFASVREHEITPFVYNGTTYYTIATNILSYGLAFSDEDELNEILAGILDIFYECGEYFYLGNNMFYNYTQDGTIHTVFFCLRDEFISGDTLKEKQNTLDGYVLSYDEQCSKILAKVLYPDMTDLEIAIALNSYLCDKLYYDNSFDTLSYTSYSAIMGEKAVCQGYSYAYEHLLHLAGIDASMVTSEDMNHAWNIICLDDNWYHVDTTWNDIANYGASHYYFLLSDDTISDRGHSNWSSDAVCNSQKYESGYFFNPKYTDKLYSNDAMTCTYTDNGYFVYNRDGTYYKSSTDGMTAQISESEYMQTWAMPVRISAPFVYENESFGFDVSGDSGAKVLLINQCANDISGMVYIKMQPESNNETIYCYSTSIPSLDSTLYDMPAGCGSNTKIFFWNISSLQPYAKPIVME